MRSRVLSRLRPLGYGVARPLVRKDRGVVLKNGVAMRACNAVAQSAKAWGGVLHIGLVTN